MNAPRITLLPYRVPYADTDKMGVVYYANYLEYFERVRNEMLRDIGLSYKEIESNGLSLQVIEAYCKYLQPAFYDDMLEIRGWFGDNTRTRITIHCEIAREEAPLATGFTIHACLSTRTQKPVRLPPGFLEKMQS